MLGVSERCNPRPQARDVILTWARASACKDRAVEYLKLPDLLPDRNFRNRFIAITRHYRTLAQIERWVARETSPQNHQSQSTIDQNRSRSLTSFGFVLLLIISGATIFAPFDFGRASDCLPAPNSPAPNGSHWYYYLERSTQQKCWYVRSSEKQPQHATAQTTSADPAVPSTIARQIAIQDPAFNTVPNRPASHTAPQENIQPLALRGNASSDASGPATATTAVVWPDPPPMAPSVTPREANAAAVDAAMNPVSDTTDSAVRNDERTGKFEIPIIIFPALAIGLVVVGFGARLVIKDSAARRAQTVDHTEAVTISYEDYAGSSDTQRADGSASLGEDDSQSFVSAVSGHAPSDSTIGSVQLTNEISRREAKLARLREDIDRRLRWPEPTHERAPKEKVAC